MSLEDQLDVDLKPGSLQSLKIRDEILASLTEIDRKIAVAFCLLTF